MQQRYYLDTCIWIDYLENRSDKFRPLGNWALRLIKQIIQDEDCIVISKLVKDELRAKLSKKEIGEMIKIVPQQLTIEIKTRPKQLLEAKEKQRELGTPLKDTVHAILARDIDAILITRDKHFIQLQEIITIRRPEDLI
jgi:predicted nucleic acid-binding protein